MAQAAAALHCDVRRVGAVVAVDALARIGSAVGALIGTLLALALAQVETSRAAAALPRS